MSEHIQVERRGSIATILLNRPAQHNAISLAMWSELTSIARKLDDDPEVRVVVVRGAGTEAFSAGADISEFHLYRSNSEQARQYAHVFEGALDALANLGKPTISLIRGLCVGGGLELATAADLRIASQDSRFGVPIARLGIVVGYNEMRRLVDLVGPGVTMDLLLTARLINAADALRVGLVSQVLSADTVEQSTYELAGQMGDLAPLSARWHKEILKTVLERPGLKDLSAEQEALPYACFDTADFQEGREAFLKKRPFHFRGK